MFPGSTDLAGRSLNPEAVKLAVAQHLPIGHAIDRYAAGKAEIARHGPARETVRQRPQHRFLQHNLNGAATSIWNGVSNN